MAEFAGLGMSSTLVFLLPLLFNSRFYFYDDGQIQHLPAFYEIGRQLANGEFPFLSLNAWYGGALLGEYQYGIMNPVTLLVSLILHLFFGNLVAGAAFISIFHLVILTTGVYAACRVMNCERRSSLIAAFGAGTSSYQFYWYASSWTPGLIAMAWFAWMVAAVFALQRRPSMRFLPALAVYLPLVSGWPFVIAGEAFFIAFVMANALIHRRRRYFWQLGALAVIGAMLAMPSLLPLVFYREMGARSLGWGGPIYGWLTPPLAWLGVGFPSFITTWTGWGNFYNYVDSPMTYVCWLLPMATVVVLRERSAAMKDRTGLLLAAIAIAFVGLTIVPFPLPISFKWPFRFIPFAHLFSMLWLARVLTVRERGGATRSGLSLTILASCILIPFAFTVIGGSGLLNSQTVKFVMRDVVVAICLFGAGALVIAADRQRYAHWMSVALATQIVFFVMMVAIWPSPLYLHDWQVPPDGHQSAAKDGTLRRLKDARGNSLFLYNPLWDARVFADPATLGKPPWIARSPWMLIGNTPFFYDVHSINGYSPIEPTAMREFFCFGIFASTTCSDSTQRLFSHDPATGVVYADLFDIDRVIAQAGPLNDAAAKTIPPTWSRSSLAGGDTLYVRQSVAAASGENAGRAGTLTHVPAGVEAKLVAFGQHRESYDVKVAEGYTGEPLVFARPWYPGYQVLANGKPLALEAIKGILIAARLPRDFAGSLEVVYTPLGFGLGLQIAVFAAILLAGWWVIDKSYRGRTAPNAP